MNIVNQVEKYQITERNFIFKSGDKISVNFKITDKTIRKKNYNFDGIIIAVKNNGLNSTYTVRKVSFGEGVEKTFFIHSPNVNFIKLIKSGDFRKSKLYYIRNKKY